MKPKPGMPPGEPAHVQGPEDTKPIESPDTPAEGGRDQRPDPNMVGVFLALLEWDLRVSMRPSPKGRLCTVTTAGELEDEDGEDGERAVILLHDVTAAELAAWVTARQLASASKSEAGAGS